jgi:hypothetical protein
MDVAVVLRLGVEDLAWIVASALRPGDERSDEI